MDRKSNNNYYGSGYGKPGGGNRDGKSGGFPQGGGDQYNYH